MTARLLFVAFLALFHLPAGIRARAERRQAEITAAAQAAADGHGVPVGLVLFIGLAETHWGLDHGEGGNWGSPADARHRHTAGTVDDQARDLATSYRICHSWLGAVSRYRCGYCRCNHLRGYTADRAIWHLVRVSTAAGVALPDHLR